MNVEGWLKDLGLEQYAEAFAEIDVDGDTLTGGAIWGIPAKGCLGTGLIRV